MRVNLIEYVEYAATVTETKPLGPETGKRG